MNNAELIQVVEWLRDNDGLVLPHGEVPGTHNEVTHGDDVIPGKDEQTWDAYQWNPPQYHEYKTGRDPKASPKPLWIELLNVHRQIFLKAPRDSALDVCDHETTVRIAELYHSDARVYPNKEYQVRLSGADTTEADEKRLEYIRICHVFEGRIERARTVKQLEKIMSDIQSDKSWPK